MKCNKCQTEKEIGEFYYYPNKTRRVPLCRQCRNDYARRRYYNIPYEKIRTYNRRHLVKKYGLTLESYDDLLKKQGGACAICKQEETYRHYKATKPDNLRIDHDHKTGKVRGLLCNACNIGISKLGENPNRILESLFYLFGN